MKQITWMGLNFGLLISALVATGCGGGGARQNQTSSAAQVPTGAYVASYGYSDGGFYSATGFLKAKFDAQGHISGVFRRSSTATSDDMNPDVLSARDSGTVTGDLVSGQANLKFRFQTDPNSHQFPINNYDYSGPYTIYTAGRLKQLRVQGSDWAVIFTIGAAQ